ITYYDVGLGACGHDDSMENDEGATNESAMIAAISADFWNSISPLTNAGIDKPLHPLCNRRVKLAANGRVITVIIRDKCPGCSVASIDVSKAAFKALFDKLEIGRAKVTW
ncbi:RlpA-like double-psi beta-barrel-protein domain-containing protein-containing protein, partial [Microdochium bolleyi]